MATTLERGLRRLARAATCAVAFAACLGMVAPSAYADASMGGMWPAELKAVNKAHADGIDGNGVKITVIDTTPVKDYPGFADADITYSMASFTNVHDEDSKPGATCYVIDKETGSHALPTTINGGDDFADWDDVWTTHGTNMLRWFVGNGKGYDGQQDVSGIVPKAKIDFVTNMFGFNETNSMYGCDAPDNGVKNSGVWAVSTLWGDAMSKATDGGSRIISVSEGAPTMPVDIKGYVKALRHGVIMVGSRSNFDLEGLPDMVGDPRFIESFPGVVQVNAMKPDGSIQESSDVVDGNVSILSPGDDVLMSGGPLGSGREYSITSGGTSTATAVLSAYLGLAVQKWPDATGNQILQSLVRNTLDNDSGEAKLDSEHKRGFGAVVPARLLSVDPTQYPDVNPILEIQMNTAASSAEYKDWYTQDCSKNPDGIYPNNDYGDYVVPCEAGLIRQEYERQQTAWKKVEQCRADGGSDCMKYSATNTADAKGSESASGERSDAKPAAGLPVWAWGVIAGVGVVVVSAGIVLAVVLAKRRRRSQRPPRKVMPAPASVYPPAGRYPVQSSPAQAYPPAPAVPPVPAAPAPVSYARPPMPQQPAQGYPPAPAPAQAPQPPHGRHSR